MTKTWKQGFRKTTIFKRRGLAGSALATLHHPSHLSPRRFMPPAATLSGCANVGSRTGGGALAVFGLSAGGAGRLPPYLDGSADPKCTRPGICSKERLYGDAR